MRSRLLLVLLLAALPSPLLAEPPVAGETGSLPVHRVADPDAALVTKQNLLASDRFWPYQVSLVQPWKPPGLEKPLGAGTRGVLIRVEDSARARIDFGRNGRFSVPIDATDLVENANRIRRGELTKMAPNFALAIGSRLVDSGAERMLPFGLPAAAERPGFLCVFADPGAEGFAQLAAALAPLQERNGVLTVLFPEGEHPDAQVRERLRSLGWTVPFLYDFLAESYTRSLLSGGTSLPALILQTNEGRVLLERSWSAELVPEVERALETDFPPVTPPASRAGRPRTTSGGRAGGNPRSLPPGGGRRSDRGGRRRQGRRSPR